MSEFDHVVEHTEVPEDDRSGLARGRRVVLGVVGGAALMAIGGLLATTLVKSPPRWPRRPGRPRRGP